MKPFLFTQVFTNTPGMRRISPANLRWEVYAASNDVMAQEMGGASEGWEAWKAGVSGPLCNLAREPERGGIQQWGQADIPADQHAQ